MSEGDLQHISQRFSAPVMRSLMTVPVIVQRFIDKAPTTGADVICLDLEDSVPPEQKEAARSLAAQAIDTMPRNGYLMYVRVNGFWTGLIEGDLDAIVRPGLQGVVISKTESVDMVRQVDDWLAGLERDRGMATGTVAVTPLIETARGIVRSADICESSGRMTGAIFGAEDYATDMGIQRTTEGAEILWARTQLAIACRAAGIAAIDTPNPDYTDEGNLRREMLLAKSLGYRGKLCIHPLHVKIANETFRASDEEVAEARQLVESFEREGLAKGLAAISFDGRMVDTPIYWRAKRLVELADGRSHEQ